mgnify:CR=1 FL=1
MSEIKKKTLSEEFAEFVKAKRMAKGMTQSDLAEKIYGDVNQKGYISKIELGKRQVSLQTMGVILGALDSWVEFIE